MFTRQAVRLWRLGAGTPTLAGGGSRSAVVTEPADHLPGCPPCAEVAGMQDTELFLSLAEIAGVFVGFGALIAVRTSGTSDMVEVTEIRWVLANAMWVIAAALVPVTISGYGIGGHELWLVGSLVATASFWAMFIVWRRNPETRQTFAGVSRAGAVGGMILNWLFLGPMLAALVIVVLGLAPDHEPALYLTAVVLGLFLTALTLLDLVFMAKRPRAA